MAAGPVACLMCSIGAAATKCKTHAASAWFCYPLMRRLAPAPSCCRSGRSSGRAPTTGASSGRAVSAYFAHSPAVSARFPHAYCASYCLAACPVCAVCEGVGGLHGPRHKQLRRLQARHQFCSPAYNHARLPACLPRTHPACPPASRQVLHAGSKFSMTAPVTSI